MSRTSRPGASPVAAPGLFLTTTDNGVTLTGTGDDDSFNSTLIPPFSGVPFIAVTGAQFGLDGLDQMLFQAGTGGTLDMLLDGGGGADTMTANLSGSTFHGDVLMTGVLEGGEGNDSLSGTMTATDFVDGILRNGDLRETLFGGSGDDRVLGRLVFEAGFDTVDGLLQLYGGDGNDALFGGVTDSSAALGGRIASAVYGGIGNDTLSVTASLSHGAAPRASARAIGGEGDDVIAATAGGGSLPASITGSGSAFVSAFAAGGAGADQVIASASKTSTGEARAEATGTGGAGDDLLVGTVTAGYGLAPADNAQAVGGYYGGGGNDRIQTAVVQVSDVLGLGEAFLLADGGGGDDRITARTAALGTGFTGTGTDRYIARAEVAGGGGADVIEATAEARFTALVAGVTLALDVDGGSGNDTITANLINNARLSPVTASATVQGGTGSDTIEVYGGDGNLIDGGRGDDILSGARISLGGQGGDVFQFRNDRAEGQDRITPGEASLIGWERDRDGLNILNADGTTVADAGAAGLLDDLEALVTVTERADGTVLLRFAAGNSVVIEGISAHAAPITSLADLVVDPATQLTSQFLI